MNETVECTYQVAKVDEEPRLCGKIAVATVTFEDGNVVSYCRKHWNAAGEFAQRLPGTTVDIHDREFC